MAVAKPSQFPCPKCSPESGSIQDLDQECWDYDLWPLAVVPPRAY